MEEWQKFEKVWAQIVARTWADEKFKQQVLEDPSSALRAYGLEPSNKYEIKVVPGATKATVELPMPNKPGGLSERSLALASENDVTVCSSCCCSC